MSTTAPAMQEIALRISLMRLASLTIAGRIEEFLAAHYHDIPADVRDALIQYAIANERFLQACNGGKPV